MYRTEKQVMDRLKIRDWGELTGDKFMCYLELSPHIGEDLHLRIIREVPDYAGLLNQAMALLHLQVGKRKKDLNDRQDVLDRSMQELKSFSKGRDVGADEAAKLLLINREIAGVWDGFRGSRRDTYLLSRYALIILFFIYYLSRSE